MYEDSALRGKVEFTTHLALVGDDISLEIENKNDLSDYFDFEVVSNPDGTKQATFTLKKYAPFSAE